jgi:hypothetical protein
MVPTADADGIRFFKIGTEVAAGKTVTVSVSESARAYAGIGTETGPSYGYSSVTYESCPLSADSAPVWWVGGFTLKDRTKGCIPLDIRVHGESELHHVTLAIETDDCP